MFVTVSTYRAKPGEEDAIVALHEDWQRTQQVQLYCSGELLRGCADKRAFVTILRFKSQELAQALENDPERKAWHLRLVSLIDQTPVLTIYTSEWSQSL